MPTAYITLDTLTGILHSAGLDPRDVEYINRLLDKVRVEATSVIPIPPTHRVTADGYLEQLRDAIAAYRSAVNDDDHDGDARAEGAADVIVEAAAALDKLLTEGGSEPAAWRDRHADAILPALLEGARAEADRAHKMHDEASAEVDRLTAERREFAKTIKRQAVEMEGLRTQLASATPADPAADLIDRVARDIYARVAEYHGHSAQGHDLDAEESRKWCRAAEHAIESTADQIIVAGRPIWWTSD